MISKADKILILKIFAGFFIAGMIFRLWKNKQDAKNLADASTLDTAMLDLGGV